MNPSNKNAFAALSAAALTLPGMLPQQVQAQAMEEDVVTSYRHSVYGEKDQPASVIEGAPFQDAAPRYEIDVHQLNIYTPVGGSVALNFSASTESMSGASPWYVLPDTDGRAVQFMSGATIEEQRDDLSVSFGFYKEASKTSIGVARSQENDYVSNSISLGSSNWFNNNNTTIDIGFNASVDEITPTQAAGELRVTEENKHSLSVSAGLTQVINRSTVAGFGVAITSYGGYLSDPYKKAYIDTTPTNGVADGVLVQDSRPSNKQQVGVDLRLRKYFEGAAAALHSDYSFFSSDWGTLAHTLSLSWYQNIGSHFQLVPTLRYYNQSAANFYRNYYTRERADGYYSSDYRLSAYEAVSAKLKASLLFDAVKAHLSFESYQSDGAGDDIQSSNPGLVDFEMISLGVDITW